MVTHADNPYHGWNLKDNGYFHYHNKQSMAYTKLTVQLNDYVQGYNRYKKVKVHGEGQVSGHHQSQLTEAAFLEKTALLLFYCCHQSYLGVVS